MMIPIVLIFVAAAIALAFFSLSKNNGNADREAVVKEILNKDALFVEFSDGKKSIVKFYGLSMASESEMMDDNILAYLTN